MPDFPQLVDGHGSTPVIAGVDHHGQRIKGHRQFHVSHARLAAGSHFLSQDGTGSVDDIYFLAAEFCKAAACSGYVNFYADFVLFCFLETFRYIVGNGIHRAGAIDPYLRVGASDVGNHDQRDKRSNENNYFKNAGFKHFFLLFLDRLVNPADEKIAQFCRNHRETSFVTVLVRLFAKEAVVCIIAFCVPQPAGPHRTSGDTRP